MKLPNANNEKGLTFDQAIRVLLKTFCDFQWRKKCKKTITLSRNQLMVLKNRRETIIRQSEVDIFQLHNHGQNKNALAKTKQLHKDQCVLNAYQQIGDFCDCLYLHLVTKQSKITAEAMEAVSSLVFAASRCGELSELTRIRTLLRKRFGKKFEWINVELLPGNCVNSELRYNLGNNSLSQEEKLQLIYKIAEKLQNLSEKACVEEKKDVQEKKDDLSSLESRDVMKRESEESKTKNIINKIGSIFFTFFYPAHLGTIHCDSIEDDSQNKHDLMREDEKSEPRYVHPKLPKYDDLVAALAEYKKEHLAKRCSKNRPFA